MPQNARKRGKKHKRKPSEFMESSVEETGLTEPGVMHQEQSYVRNDAPFGAVDPDLKAYFKTVDSQLQEWGDSKNRPEQQEIGDDDSQFIRSGWGSPSLPLYLFCRRS
jgi:nucleolar protein 9